MMDLVNKTVESNSNATWWKANVAPLINFLNKNHLERAVELITYDSMKSVAFWRNKYFDNCKKIEALAREDFFTLNKYDGNRDIMYLAERLNRTCCTLGAYEKQRYPGPEGYIEVESWQPDHSLRQVVAGNRDPDTLGKALGWVDWFRHCLREFETAEQQDQPTVQLTSAPNATGPKLSLRQVALFYIYEGKHIPKAADEIARKYGHKSGAKLYEHYNKFFKRADRTGLEGQKLAPMIKAITGLIPHLTGAALQQAKSELQTLEAKK